MNREDIIRMARESYERGQSDLMESCKEASVKAIELAVLAEREACAKVCDERADEDKWEGCYANACAEAIRARGETK